jgi:uncharacterized cupredoxin-like copper-binding protein
VAEQSGIRRVQGSIDGLRADWVEIGGLGRLAVVGIALALVVTFAALAITILLVAAACSNNAVTKTGSTATVDDHAADEASDVLPSGDANRVVEVELSEFDIAANSFEFAPGETIEFIVTNSGVAQHELRLSNQDRVDEHIAGGHDDGAMSDEEMEAMDEEADKREDNDSHGEEVEDALLIVEAGATSRLCLHS